MHVILGSSWDSYDKTIRVSCGNKSISWWLRRTHNQMAKVNPIRSCKPSSLPLHKHLRFNITNTSMYVTHVTACSFYLCAKVFLQDWLETDFFPHRGFYFSASHTDSPIVGASDMSQVSTLYLGQDLVHFKYFYILKKPNTFLFSQRRSTQRYRSKYSHKGIHIWSSNNTGSSMLYLGHKDIPFCVGFYVVSCKLHDKYMITDSHQLSFLL